MKNNQDLQQDVWAEQAQEAIVASVHIGFSKVENRWII